MDIVARPHPKWPGYLDVVVTPGDSYADEIEMWASFTTDHDQVDLDSVIRDVAQRIQRSPDEFESCRYEADPNTGAAGSIDRMAVVRKTELLIEGMLPDGVLLDEIA